MSPRPEFVRVAVADVPRLLSLLAYHHHLLAFSSRPLCLPCLCVALLESSFSEADLELAM